jgi:hypothetical protein
MIHSYTYRHSEEEKFTAALDKVTRFLKRNPDYRVIEMTYRCSDNGFVVYYLNKREENSCLVCNSIIGLLPKSEHITGYFNGHITTSIGDCIFAISRVERPFSAKDRQVCLM